MSMSLERTRETLTAYAQALLARGAYADYFSEDVVFTVMGNGEETRGGQRSSGGSTPTTTQLAN